VGQLLIDRGSNLPALAQEEGTPADRGLLGNPILLRQPVKSVYFFAGNWRAGFTQHYEHPIDDNIAFYTQFPENPQHLGWSEKGEDRALVLDEMLWANVNVVTMSYWGARGDDRWAFSAPMHTSTFAHDELFHEATTRNIVVIPAIEDGKCTQGGWQGWGGFPGHPQLSGAWQGQSSSFNFASEFPYFRGDPASPRLYSPADPAPALTRQIEDLLRRYVISPADPAWPSRWAKIYDSEGAPRYAINLIHVASNQIGRGEGAFFASAFDDVANAVFRDTGQKVGFLLDVIPFNVVPVPPDNSHQSNHFADQNCGTADEAAAKWPDTFLADPETTGPLLRNIKAVLGIQAFIPEVWTGLLPNNEPDTRNWKIDFIRRWVSNGPPVFLDVGPGYATHEGFDPTKPVWGWGWNDDWLNFQSELKATGIRGITFNTWNGYTEGTAAVPADGGIAFLSDRRIVHFRPPGQTDFTAYEWLKHLYANDPQICDHWHFVDRQPTHHVFGAICDKWRAMGGSLGALGPPVSSEFGVLCANGQRGRQTDFAQGHIVWDGSRAFEIQGAIAQLWSSTGGACGSAGFPRSDETGPPNRRESNFTHGTIVWTHEGGAVFFP
jgi:hypothetical protein